MDRSVKSLLPLKGMRPRILLFRDQYVILDFDLAELYRVETRALKQAVKRNRRRFPVDFMFELTTTEVNTLVSQFVIPTRGKFGGAVPMAFTEGRRDAVQRLAQPTRRSSQYRHHACICSSARNAHVECRSCPQGFGARGEVRQAIQNRLRCNS